MNKLFYMGFVILAFSFCVANSVALDEHKVVEERDTEVNIILNDGYTQEILKKEIQSVVGYNYRVVGTYNGLINGLKIKVNSNYLSELKQLDSVKTLSKNIEYNVASSIDEYFDSDKYYTADEIKNDSVITMNVPTSSKGGENTFIAIIDDSLLLNHNAFTNLSSSTKKRVSKDKISTILKLKGMHANATISNSYYNDKIPFYYDYGGSTISSLFGTTHDEDHDVYNQYSSHGMHTSSTAVANGAFKGVAPNAQLAFLKVSTENTKEGTSSIYSDSILNAFNDCYYLGVDVISMSIGSALDEDQDTSLLVTLKKLQDSGIIVNVAAGNDGKGNWNNSGIYKYFTTDQVETGILGSYATYSETTTVAAGLLDNDSSAESVISVNGVIIEGKDQIVSRFIGTSNEILYDTQKPFHGLIKNGDDSIAIEYVMVPGFGSFNTVVDGVNYGDDYKNIDVKGKIAVVKRGKLSFTQKIQNAFNKGAIGIIIANDSGLGSMSYFKLTDLPSNEYIPTFSISKEEYDILDNQETKVLTISKDMMTSFSSEGTLGGLGIKPEVTAPGQNIIGAVCDNEKSNTYQYYDGTSMATPNYSGSYVLALGEKSFDSEEERKTYSKTIKNRFMSTANPIMNSNDVFTRVRRQGAGMIDVSSAINTNIYLKGDTGESKIELGNNDNIKNGLIDFDVTIVNENKSLASYTPTLYVTVPLTTYCDSELYPEFKDVKFQTINQRLVAKVPLSTLKLDGSNEQKYHVSYQLTDAAIKEIFDDFENGIDVEGYVIFKTNDSSFEDLSIPYLGFIGDYTKGECVEPFQFEKEDNKVYASDLLNNLLQVTSASKTEANFSSFMGVTTGGLNGIDMEPILLNNTNPSNIFAPVLTSVDENGVTHIKVGNVGKADTIYCQQFVNRSVKDNFVTLEKGTGSVKELVLTDHMFDSLTSTSNDTTHPLTKTFATTTLYSNQYITASRAYSIFPLKDKSNGTYYEDGDYTLTFNYTLMDGTIQKKEYILEIKSDNSDDDFYLKSISEDNFGVTISFNDECFKITLDDIEGIKKENNQYYFSKDSLNNKSLKDGLYLDAYTSDYSRVYGLISNNGNGYINGSEITKGMNVNIQTVNGNNKINVIISIYNSKGNPISIRSSNVTVNLFLDSSYENVIVKNERGFTLESTFENGILSFTTSEEKVVIKYGDYDSSNDNQDKRITIYTFLSSIILVGIIFAIISLRKKLR